jgi:hypothetical protein
MVSQPTNLVVALRVVWGHPNHQQTEIMDGLHLSHLASCIIVSRYGNDNVDIIETLQKVSDYIAFGCPSDQVARTLLQQNGRCVVGDKKCQFTSLRFVEKLSSLGIQSIDVCLDLICCPVPYQKLIDMLAPTALPVSARLYKHPGEYDTDRVDEIIRNAVN